MATLEIAPGTSVRFDRRAIATKVDTSGRPITGADRAPTTPTDAPGTDPEK
jgi:hypothetical protein